MPRAEKVKEPPCLTAALDYLKRGWAAIPLCPPNHHQCGDRHRSQCKRPGKAPLLSNWQAKKLTEAELRARWKTCPAANVGVACGPLSSLVSIDLDGEEGVELLDELARTHGRPMPDTLSFQTGGGGRLLYALPEGEDPPQRQWKNAKGDEILRFQAGGGQTVMPPSVHHSGLLYRWCEGLAPGEIEIAPCPAWLLALAYQKDDQGGGATGGGARQEASASAVAPSPPGRPSEYERCRLYLDRMGPCDPRPDASMDASTHLLKAATACVGFGLSDEEAVSLLDEWDRGNPCGNYPEKEYRRKLSEARRLGHVRHGELAEEDRGKRQPPQTARPEPPAEAQAEGERPVITTSTAADLLDEELPPLRWVVPGLIPEGAVLLAGRPKGGKSWLALQLCLALAEGAAVWGHTVAPRCETLYLALEDGKRRLRSRLQLLCGDTRPRGMHYRLDWPTLGKGGAAELRHWLAAHPAVKLAVVDTLTKMRDRNARGNSSYELDYDAVSVFAQAAQEQGVSVVIVHHTRKPKDEEEEDPFDTISGTLGLSGAADTIIVLKKPAHSNAAKLHVRGRDIEDQTLRIEQDQQTCLWRVLGKKELTQEQRTTLEAVEAAGKAATKDDVAAALGILPAAALKRLQRLEADGHVTNNRGSYAKR